jgi:hypothetical protein
MKKISILMVVILISLPVGYIINNHFEFIDDFTGEKANGNHSQFKFLNETSYETCSDYSGTSYYFSTSGDDRNSGLSKSNPKQNLDQIYTINLQPGDAILLKRGDVFDSRLHIEISGNKTHPIVVCSFGEYPNKPKIQGSITIWGGVLITASYVVVENLYLINWYAGIGVANDADGIELKNNYLTSNIQGIVLSNGRNHHIHHNNLLYNNIMAQDTPGDDDDYGAQGIVVGSDYTIIEHNQMIGHYAISEDYGYDGSGMEVYGGSHNIFRYNYLSGNEVFTELGTPEGKITKNNTFYRNLVINEESPYLVVQHIESNFGPVYNTSIIENIVIYNSSTNWYGPLGIIVGQGDTSQYLNWFDISGNIVLSTYFVLGYDPWYPNLDVISNLMKGNTFHYMKIDDIGPDNSLIELIVEENELFIYNQVISVKINKNLIFNSQEFQIKLIELNNELNH